MLFRNFRDTIMLENVHLLLTFLFLVTHAPYCQGMNKKPLEYCGDPGSKVCLDCDTPVTCAPGTQNGYLINPQNNCSNLGILSYGCDNEYVPGLCTASPRCYCGPEDNKKGCKLDPNDAGKLILCDSRDSKNFQNCGMPENVDLATCSCRPKEENIMERSAFSCEHEDQKVCMTCTITGVCRKSSKGDLVPVPISSCTPGQLCDNSIAPGQCQDRKYIEDTKCLAMSAEPGFTDDLLDKSFKPSSLARQNGIESSCVINDAPICVDCSVVGRCILSGGNFGVVSIFDCNEDYVCDNSLVPGQCLATSIIPETAPCLATTAAPTVTAPGTEITTQSPAVYCTGDGSLTCVNCNTIGSCVVTGTTIQVSTIAVCAENTVCDNSDTPGRCQEINDIPSSACSSQIPSSFCTAAGDSVCSSCSLIGVCVADGVGGFTVEPTAFCSSNLFCDNSFMPGTCLSAQDLTGSSCVTTDPTTPSVPVSSSTPTTPVGTCGAQGQSICIDCFTIGTCVAGADGTFSLEPNSGCLPDAICDNDIQEGFCVQSSTADPNSKCLPQSPEVYCDSDLDSVCLDCTSVGICTDDGTGTFTVSPNSNCITGSVCDNFYSPGECQPESAVPSSTCMAITTPPPVTSIPRLYCMAPGDRVCYSCDIIGTCVISTTDSSQFDVIEETICPSSSQVCDNDLRPGECVEAETVINTSFCAASVTPILAAGRIQFETTIKKPEDFCFTEGEKVCYNCTVAGKCTYKEGIGMVVDPVSLCASSLVCDNSISKGICIPPERYDTSSCTAKGFSNTGYSNKKIDGNEKISHNAVRIPKVGDSCRLSRALNSRDNCNRYLRCVNGRLDNARCPGSYCFDEESGKCLPPRSTQRDREDDVPCPACGYKRDTESGTCRGFIKCSSGLERESCPENFCFDEYSCSCTPSSLLQNIYARIFNYFK